MASNTAVSSGVEPMLTFGKYISCTRSENEVPPHLGNRLDLDFSMRNDVSDAAVKIDPVLEQIERNRRIAELLSPVLKYKEMMRKCRSRAVPRRKFSIAQGYPRINRWKITTQSRGLNTSIPSCYSLKE
ncbi:hypothetical protein KIN20_019388 [Parelaphostrongylus tenuis]|uniref:Uncharacterized protein n=1 Tax=Parelaphostrongylus tenuis TaxID=148309 RepID=A0AAD5N5H3_PARTN|nr:hypothetical protein KIN20_019388 [Parelaphostrongylus tenuis]